MDITTNVISKHFTSPWNKRTIYKQLEDFSTSLGWYPSDIIAEKHNSILTGHIFVEHGLENSAVISFINNRHRFEKFTRSEHNELAKISYNNLVDIHVAVDDECINAIHNRVQNDNLIYTGKIDAKGENLRSEFIQKLVEQKNPRTNLKALDDALIDTISYWKKYVSSELNNDVSNEHLSTLFNAIIFCRAIEDNDKKRNTGSTVRKYLIQKLISENCNITTLISSCLLNFNVKDWPENLITKNYLEKFNVLNDQVLYELINDFYLIKYTPYEYDFSIMSKHSLSRIYERYVTLLRVEPSSQLTLYPSLPTEHTNKQSGSYYTPQFIARFFSRYIESNYPTFHTKSLSIVEPAVGSGIFLRTLLEKKGEILQSQDKIENLSKVYENILGVDVNPTACHAANLSLSLLYLAETGELPQKDLKIISDNSLDYFDKKTLTSTFDIFISNPPFVSYNALSNEERAKIKNYLGDYSFGKTDLYLPFIKMAVDFLKNGGLGLFVLPNTFLISDSAKDLRKLLFEQTSIRCIVDLSGIQVFDDTGIYPILLIFEKKSSKNKPNHLATIAKVQDDAGKALLDIINNGNTESDAYNIYQVPQTFFDSKNWYLFSPSEYSLKNKLDKLDKLSTICDVRTGFASGNTNAFIRNKKQIDKNEMGVFVPYLSDREMNIYTPPKDVEEYFFFPIVDDNLLDEKDIITKFPKTWNYLSSHKKALSKRTEVIEGKLAWWRPNRTRTSSFMLVPKIVTPHLVFTSKFCLDISGKYAISRAPFVVLKDTTELVDKDLLYADKDLLYYITALLNSTVCFWYLINHAPKYQRGYSMLEPKYIKSLPIPTLDSSNSLIVREVIKLVKERVHGKAVNEYEIDRKLDNLICNLYNLTNQEKDYLNINI